LCSWIGDQRLSVTSTSRSGRINCALTKENPNALEGPKNLDTEPHKYFDQVIITVRSGDGGNGAVLKLPKPKVDDSESRFKKKDKKPGTYKRGNDGALILPLGGHGGDVVLVADESADTLLPYHRKRRHNARRGANVSSMGTLSPALRDGLDAPVLRIPVPVGKAFHIAARDGPSISHLNYLIVVVYKKSKTVVELVGTLSLSFLEELGLLD